MGDKALKEKGVENGCDCRGIKIFELILIGLKNKKNKL